MRKEAPESSVMITVISLAITSFLLFSVVTWHQDRSDADFTQDRRRLSWSSQPTIDDDTHRDAVCMDYVERFLNGTTDAKDECEGMFNAYQAADCKDDKDIHFWDLWPWHHRKHDNPDDDVVIDDNIENWHCCYSINEYYSKHCKEAGLASFKLLGIVSVLVLCSLVKSLIQTFKVEWIPEAAACIVVGGTVGGFMKIFNPNYINDTLVFDNDLFLHILLPPIIFQQSLSIDKTAFKRDFFPIVSFAVLGTVMSAIVVGYLTHWITSIGSGTTLPLLDSLLFGSLISSIDPVATLSILSGIGVGQSDTLYTLIFGESLLNDGVAIVLFDTLVEHLGDVDVVTQATVHDSVEMFFRVSLGSIGIGTVCAVLCTIYFWVLRRKHTAVVEVAIFSMWSLIPFYLSDGIGYSGIISIMTMGFLMDYFIIGGSRSEEEQWMDYMELRGNDVHLHDPTTSRAKVWRAFSGRGHMSSRSRHHVKFVADVIASVMETAIFAYLGLFLLSDNHTWDFRLNSTAVFGCITSRVLMIFVISLLINFFVWLDLENRISALCQPRGTTGDDTDESLGAERVYLTTKTQQVLVLAGIRGAVSFALVENIPVYDAARKTGSSFKLELKAMTSVSILFTVFVFGGFTYYFLKRQTQQPVSADNPLAHRLLSDPLNSDDENDQESRSGFETDEYELSPP